MSLMITKIEDWRLKRKISRVLHKFRQGKKLSTKEASMFTVFIQDSLYGGGGDEIDEHVWDRFFSLVMEETRKNDWVWAEEAMIAMRLRQNAQV